MLERKPYDRYKNIDTQTACCAAAMDTLIYTLLPTYGYTEDGNPKGIVSDVFHLGVDNAQGLEKEMKKRYTRYLKDSLFFIKEKKSLLPKIRNIDLRLELLESEPEGIEKTFKLLSVGETIDPDVVTAIEEQSDIIFGTSPWKIHKVIMSEKTKDLVMRFYDFEDLYEVVLLEYYDYGVVLFSGRMF